MLGRIREQLQLKAFSERNLIQVKEAKIQRKINRHLLDEIVAELFIATHSTSYEICSFSESFYGFD